YGRDVHLHHLELARQLDLEELSVGAKAGIIHQQFNVDSLLLRESEELVGCPRPRQIGGEDLDLHAVLGVEVRPKLLEPFATARRQHAARPPRSALLRHRPPAPRARASPKPPLAPPVIHRASSLRRATIVVLL